MLNAALLLISVTIPGDSPLAPLPADRWTLEAARHLLDRAGFGGTPAEIAQFHALGLDGAVDRLLAPVAPPQRFPAERKYRRPDPLTMLSATEEERKAARRDMARDDRIQAEEYRDFWIRRMIAGDAPLVEKLALFWHGYFTSSQRDVRNSYAMARQIDLYREDGLGSFRSLLHKASKEPAMLAYLDNDKNRRGHPNENFAREVMELFTLGPGNYTEKDIREAARAFTGWGIDGAEFVTRPRQHDPGSKTVLGVTGNLDGDRVLDVLLQQPACAPFVTKKLVAFFMRPDPSEPFVTALAADFAASDDDVRGLLRELFRSAEFYAPESRAALFKSPVEFFVGTVRRLGIEAPPAPFPAFACEQLGQSLLEPPNVKGWDGGDDWISSSTILQRANVARTLVHGVDPKERRPANGGAGGKDALARIAAARARDWRPGTDAAAMIGDATTASAAVATLCDRLLPVSPARSTVDELARYVAPYGDDAFDPTDVATRELLNDCVHLILSLPEYQLN